MFNSHISKALFYLKVISRASPTLIRYRPLQHCPLSLKYSTNTSSGQYSFTVSYLINSCGFSPEAAVNASKIVRFVSAERPDSVLAFFRNHSFSNSQITYVIRRAPKLLLFDPNKTLSPKFEFLLSKGASRSDIVLMVNRYPRFLYSSLENNIIPTYELVRRFFQSDEKAVGCIIVCPGFFANDLLAQNVKLLLENGMTESNITHLLRTRPSILLSYDLRKAVDEVKELGFNPSKSIFSIALIAKKAMSKPRWDAKVDAFKSWGWSEETILEAFKKQPNCMLASEHKINALMSFWVNQLGWNSLALVTKPELFGYSLEKRIIPRAFVVQYLLAKGLRDKNANLLSPFGIPEKLFLENYVKRFKEDAPLLLKLYNGKK